MTTSKIELRISVKKAIAALDSGYLTASEAAAAEHVRNMPEYTVSQNILLYVSVGREVSTLSLISSSLSAGKNVYLPRSLPCGFMDAAKISNADFTDFSDLSAGLYGIPVPSDDAEVISPQNLDLVIVPALAFDKRGRRLGQGGGYYDRYLRQTDAYTIGLTREKLLLDEVPVEDHDRSVKSIVTETGVRRFY